MLDNFSKIMIFLEIHTIKATFFSKKSKNDFSDFPDFVFLQKSKVHTSSLNINNIIQRIAASNSACGIRLRSEIQSQTSSVVKKAIQQRAPVTTGALKRSIARKTKTYKNPWKP